MSARKDNRLLDAVDRYYSEKVEAFGATPAGVDWNGRDSQELRFAQLMRIVTAEPFTLNDIGCGYGALVDYLDAQGLRYEYLGVDISEPMVRLARLRHGSRPNCSFEVSQECTHVADYSVASGIFNVKLNAADEEWLAYILGAIRALDRVSRKGFAFNCLTKYSDPERMRANLYYADPCFLFDHCKRKLSRHVALLHDYGLYEFTMLVRKQETAAP